MAEHLDDDEIADLKNAERARQCVSIQRTGYDCWYPSCWIGHEGCENWTGDGLPTRPRWD